LYNKTNSYKFQLSYIIIFTFLKHMGYKEITIKQATDYNEVTLKNAITKELGISECTIEIIRKSLDARDKRRIHWEIRVGVQSKELKGGEKPLSPVLNFERKQRKTKIAIVGSGPAGIFSALLLAEAGFMVTLIERGKKVEERKDDILQFEKGNGFVENSNYGFGEGGAGTFSDGKLTSRTKSIIAEKQFIYDYFIACGAPQEISYMTHPHLGSDNLFHITQNLRKRFLVLGGTILFSTMAEDLVFANNKLKAIRTNKGDVDCEVLLFATGHSAYETIKMLIRNGVKFQHKNFAIGSRAEHPQELINRAQWNCNSLPGVKAAEYRLTSQDDKTHSVYTFCMCPGGVVVPAAVYPNTSIVNGMSNYQRNNNFANAAVVAGLNLNTILKKEVEALQAIAWLDELEHKAYNITGSYKAPAMRIADFIKGKTSNTLPSTSFPLGLACYDLREIFPISITRALQQGLQNFSRKLKGYETGILIGLESKTSSVVQVLRDRETMACSIDNVYVAGEGSGWAGGIISSVADGIRVAMQIEGKYS
jgi:uncharacterized protein